MKVLVSVLVVLITLNSAQGLAFRRLFCQLGVTQLCQNQNQGSVIVVRVPSTNTGTGAVNNNGFANVPAILNAANQALNNAAGGAAAGGAVTGNQAVGTGNQAAGAVQPAAGVVQPAAGAGAVAAPAAPPAAGRDAQLVYKYDPYDQYLSYGDDEYDEDYEGARQRQRQRRRPNVQVINLNRRGNRRNRGNRRRGVNVVRG